MKKTIKRVLGLNTQKTPEQYREKVLTTADPATIVTGAPEDRLHGLDTAFERAAGRTVLDVGCHNGTVARAFADHGSVHIDGFDLSPAAVAEAREKTAGTNADTRIVTGDLSLGFDGINDALRLPRYDIVCYLGVHHHLQGQLSAADLERLERSLMDLAGELFVLRVPLRFQDDFAQRLLLAGFKPVTDVVEGRKGSARVFERVAQA